MAEGLIHNESDLKILILYILSKLSAPVDKETLFDVCICDGGVEYFDFSEFLNNLADSGQVLINGDDEFYISEKGRSNVSALEGELPLTVRLEADKAIAPVELSLKRQELIKAEDLFDKNGYTVHLVLSDGEVELLDMSVFCGDESRAKKIKRAFKKNAEDYYSKIMKMLSDK